MQEKVFANSKIDVIWDSEVKEILGDQKLESITIRNSKTEEESEIKLDGLFVAIGHDPSSQIFKGLIDLDSKGYIIPKENSKTNIPGVFVSGDVHDHTYKQAVTAAGYGCMAAMSALNYLAELK